MLKQVVRLEDNRELVQDQTLKHSDSRELICQSNMLGKNMKTIGVELDRGSIRSSPRDGFSTPYR